MSFFSLIEQDLAACKKWFDGNPIGNMIENDFRAAVAELQSVAVADLENAAKVIGLSALAALATGGTSAAIAAGITAAETEFKSLSKDISTKTLNTLVTTVVNQIHSQTAPTPVAAPSA